MKKITSFLLAAGLCVSMAGCGSQQIEFDTNTVYFQRDTDVITEILVDQLRADEHFTEQELRAYVEEDILYWNEQFGENTVTIDEVTVSEAGEIRIQLEYLNSQSYADSHRQTFYYGTVQQAIDAGYTIPDQLYDRYGGPFDTQIFQKDSEDYCIAFFSEPVQIQTDTRIIGATQNVTLIDKTKAEALPVEGDTEGMAIQDSEACVLFKAK